MTTSSPAAAVSANRRSISPDEMGSNIPVPGSVSDLLVSLLKDLFGPKPWVALGRVLSISDRLAKHRIYRTREFTADELAQLIRTEHGFEIIIGIMADAETPPKWWRTVAPLVEAHELRKTAIQAKRRAARLLQDTLNEVDESEMALERADTALAFSQANPRRPMADLGRENGRVPRRPVAAAGRRG